MAWPLPSSTASPRAWPAPRPRIAAALGCATRRLLPMDELLTHDPLRWAWACALLLGYALWCAAIYRQQRRARQQAAAQAAQLASSGGRPILVAYASQTGQAQALAEHCAQQLHAAGWAVTLQPLNQTTAAQLQAATHAILIASTYGEGDAPDNAALFQRQCMSQALPLHQLRYSLLALGDRQYAQFCGFGRALDGWLQAQHAQPLHARIDVDQADDSASALADWQAQLAQALQLQPSTTALPTAPSPSTWTLAARQHLNPGSQGGAVYHLEFQSQSAEAQAQRWQSGDLVDLAPPQEPTVPRSYSIASIPEDGRLHLLVRQTQRSDGTPGRASHWLMQELALGDNIPLLLRAPS